MRSYRDQAVVLRQRPLGEADRIVTLLTREHGIVRAAAKGVRRTKSRFGARLEPFAHIDVQLYPGRTLDTITQVHTVEANAAGIVNDYGRYTAGCAVLETAERLAGTESAPVTRLHMVTAGAVRALSVGQRAPGLILDAFFLRAMGCAGWAPALTECARCATPGPHRAFHVAAGGVVCVQCRPPGAATPAPEVVEFMLALRDGAWDKVQVLSAAAHAQATGLIAAQLQWHLERRLRTLALVERAPRREESPSANIHPGAQPDSAQMDPADSTITGLDGGVVPLGR